jgi:hypothetical protein
MDGVGILVEDAGPGQMTSIGGCALNFFFSPLECTP